MLKKQWAKGFLAGVIAALILTAGAAFASGGLEAVTAYFDSRLHITYNGVEFNPTEPDGTIIPALLYRDRTYLPVRALAEQSGVFVDYDDQTAEVILKNENALLARAVLALHYLKYRDFVQLARMIHKEKGVTFSPYAYTEDSAMNFSAYKIASLDPERVYLWGAFDGSGNPMNLSVDEYFARFVYNADFMRAPTIGVNNIVNLGNTLSNLGEAFPRASFVEFYVPGKDPKYGGMDWNSLRLVFEESGDAWMLVGIVHDCWTI